MPSIALPALFTSFDPSNLGFYDLSDTRATHTIRRFFGDGNCDQLFDELAYQDYPHLGKCRRVLRRHWLVSDGGGSARAPPLHRGATVEHAGDYPQPVAGAYALKDKSERLVAITVNAESS